MPGKIHPLTNYPHRPLPGAQDQGRAGDFKDCFWMGQAVRRCHWEADKTKKPFCIPDPSLTKSKGIRH